MEEMRKGRKRSIDSILLGIKAAVLEFDHRFAKRQPTHADVIEFTGKLKAAYFHGSKLVAPIYVKAIEVLDHEILKMRCELEIQESIKKERKEQGVQRWS